MAQWAKVSSDLDSNPKIRKAGRNGREVFLFALRRNAALDLGGRIPAAHMEGWYLADQLMMGEADAMSGLSQCVRTGLLLDEGDHFIIAGWDDEWAKRPLTEAERKKQQRAKSRTSAECPDIVRTPSGHVRTGPECHVLEEKRREEIRVEEKISASPPARAEAAPPALVLALPEQPKQPKPKAPPSRALEHFGQRYQAAYGSAPDWGRKGHVVNLAKLVKRHGDDEVIRRIDILFDGNGPTWLKPPFTIGTVVSQWDGLVKPTEPTQRASRPHDLRAGDLLEAQLQRIAELEALEQEESA